MLIDEPNRLRPALLKLINMPNNEEIIYYNEFFLGLENEDIDIIYIKNLARYKELNEQYQKLKLSIDEYNDRINNLKLVDKKMSESEYINEIQKLEIEYKDRYKDIKIIENKISMLEDNIKDINNRINIQKSKEIQDIKNQEKKLLDDELKLKYEISYIKDSIKLVNEKIKFAKESKENIEFEYDTVLQLKSKIESGNYSCPYCNSRVDRKVVSGTIFDRIEKNIIKLESKLQVIKDTIEKEFDKKNELEARLTLKNIALNNIKSIKKQDILHYTKKSINVLKLEAIKFDIVDKIDELKKSLNEKIRIEGPLYIKLRDKIQLYKDSLDNLRDLRYSKKEMDNNNLIISQIISEAKKVKSELIRLVEFIDIRNKLMEKRLSEYFDCNIKFELFEKNEFEFKEIMNMLYNGIQQKYWKLEEEKLIESILKEKLSILEV